MALSLRFLLLSMLLAVFASASAAPIVAAPKTSRLTADTPAPTRFIVRGTSIVDLANNKSVFFRGIGYSPYLPGETPLNGAAPGDDARYVEHMKLVRELGANYLHVFPMQMPPGFFAQLDKTSIVYGQDIWIEGRTEDFLDNEFQARTFAYIKAAIDHAYTVGRPDRLVLFSIGDELQANGIVITDTRHPEVHDYTGRHVVVTGRTATEVAIARLIDSAMDYELTHYQRRHLYCHTSWTHVGPIVDRPDIEVPAANALTPDMGDLMCLNVYTYANGVKTSEPGSVTGTTYQGYLEALARTAQVPVFITQVGLATSPIEPKPWVPGFGGHGVADVPDAFRAVWKDIRTAMGHEKFCGLAFFELQDEWWKSGEDPADTNRHEENDPEEWFGLYEVGKNNALVAKGRIPETVRNLFAEP